MPKGFKGITFCTLGCGKRAACRGLCDKHSKQWKRENVPGYNERARKITALWRKNNHERHLANCNRWRKDRRQKDKDLCYSEYGGYVCSCCGETEPLFLTLDHIHGGGQKHRKETQGHIYRWIVKNNFPEGMFCVLCSNCNSGRARNGGICPHKEKKK